MRGLTDRSGRASGWPKIRWIACCIFAVQCLFSESLRAMPTLFCQSGDEVFEEVEPGVRLLGNPSPSAALGVVLGFQPVLETDQIIAVCADGLKLWDMNRQKILKSVDFERPITNCNTIALSHDQQTVAISTWSYSDRDVNQPGIVLLVDRELNHRARLTIDCERTKADDQANPGGSLNAISAIAFSKDDSKIALASSKAVFRCDVASGDIDEMFELREPRSITQLIIQEDRILGLGWQSFQIDRKSGTVSKLQKPIEAMPQFHMMRFDEKMKRVFGLGANKVSVVDLLDGSKEEIEQENPGTTAVGLALSDDGSLLAVVSLQPRHKPGLQISVFDTTTASLKYRFDDLEMRPQQLEFSAANNALLVAFGFDVGIQRLEFDPQNIQQDTQVNSNQPVRTMLLSADGKKLAGSLINTKGVLWDWSTGEESSCGQVNTFYPSQWRQGFFSMGQQGTQLSIMRNDWQKPNPTKIQTYSIRRPLVLPALGYLSGISDNVRTEAYYVFPMTLAVDNARSELHCVVQDMLDGIRIQTIALASKKRTRNVLFKRPKSSLSTPLVASAITNDGKRFAIVESGQLKMIDVETEETIFELPAKDVDGLVFSTERRWLAMANKRGVTILDSDSGDVLKKIEEPGALMAYAFDSDNMLVASPERGGRVQIFDTTTWRTTVEHRTETSRRVSATISHDGRRVAFALDDCRMELWDVDELKR